MVDTKKKYKLTVIFTMLIWSSVGIFSKEINLNPYEIAFFRSVIGCIFILSIVLLRREKIDFEGIKANYKVLIVSGASLGLGWTMQFLGFKYTTVSITTLAYYNAPIIIIIMSAILLKEKITLKKVLCILAALGGLALIVNSNASQAGDYNHKLGITYAVIGAFFYASLVVLNKFVKDISNSTMTIFQLFMAAVAIIPFLFINGMTVMNIDGRSLIFLFIVGILHTGIVYIIYLSTVKHLEGQTLAILSYIDPIFAVILSSIILSESLGFLQIIGGILILGSAFISEYK